MGHTALDETEDKSQIMDDLRISDRNGLLDNDAVKLHDEEIDFEQYNGDFTKGKNDVENMANLDELTLEKNNPIQRSTTKK